MKASVLLLAWGRPREPFPSLNWGLLLPEFQGKAILAVAFTYPCIFPSHAFVRLFIHSFVQQTTVECL